MIVAISDTTPICAICRGSLPKPSNKKTPVRPRRSSRLNHGIEDHSNVDEEEESSILNRVRPNCCNAEYHATCLLLWIQMNATCPLCRKILLNADNRVLAPRCTRIHEPDGYDVSQRNERIRLVSMTLIAFALFTSSLLWILHEWYSHGFFHIFIMLGSSAVTIIFSTIISYMIYTSVEATMNR